MRLSTAGLALLVAGGALAQAAAPRAQTPTAGELAARIQAHYASVADFTADFTLTQTSAIRPRPRTEEGRLLVKKPLRVRWTYTSSDRNEFVADGTMLYASYPADRYVDVSELPEDDDQTSTLLRFLAGRGDLTRDFVPRLAEDHPPGEWRLHLTPVDPQTADVESMTLEVDRTSLKMTGLVLHDGQGGTSAYRFTDLRENQGLSDALFTFRIPDGFEVNWIR